MKRLVALVFALLCMVGFASAESFDLSGMSFDDLVALKDQINLAIWSSEEWQEVEVPQGVWTVGEDIPAGKWTIKAYDGLKAHVYWGDMLDDSGVDLSYKGKIYEYAYLYSESYRSYEKGDKTEITWELADGQYVIVDSGIVVFSPYAGKASLGFK